MALVNDLPPDWDSYGPAQKIAWFNANSVSVDELQSAGVDSATINWMLGNGYNPPPEPTPEPVYTREPVKTIEAAYEMFAATLIHLAQNTNVLGYRYRAEYVKYDKGKYENTKA